MSATAHRLRFATPPHALVRWPSSFGCRFVLTVDTEEEFDWSAPFDSGARSVTAMAALPSFHDRMAADGIVPCYLVDQPAADDPAGCRVIRALAESGAEIGTQLHPWVTEPQDGLSDTLSSFAGNLPPALEKAKLEAVTAAVTRAAGRAPRIYRAGRYGLGPSTARVLAECGYVADTSMRARFDYRADGGPDFSRVTPAAFRWDAGLLELPPSTIYIGRFRNGAVHGHPRLAGVPYGRGLAARLGLFSRVPLTPEGTSAGEAIAAVRTAKLDGERLLQLSFHSPSLVPGHTPYVRTASDLRRFHAWWDAVLAALTAHGYRPATVQQVLDAAACQPAARSATTRGEGRGL